MDRLLGLLALLLIKLLQLLPLNAVARLGRACGAVAYLLDRRHRRVAIQNIAHWMQTSPTAQEPQAIARENFRRLGEAYCCGIKTASMSIEQIIPRLELQGLDELVVWHETHPERNVIAAIGHFGNFELYARFGQLKTGFRCATTYRGLRQPAVDQLLQSLRIKSGCEFFERRRDAAALKAALAKGGLLLGLLADQHAGDRGLPLPFLGRTASTSAAPAVLAQRYNAPLCVAICYRTGLARWRIECTGFIPTHENDRPRDPSAIMLEVNQAYEAAIRRDPANWFWVHNRWKPGKHRKPAATSEAPSESGETVEATDPTSLV